MSRSDRGWTVRLRPLVAGGVVAGGLVAVGGASGGPLDRPAPAVSPTAEMAERAAQIRAEQERRETTLRDLEGELRANAESRARLESEVGVLEADQAKLKAALVDTASRAHAAEEQIAATEERLRATSARELAVRRSLEARRGLIAQVLAALQRMGRRPPPAVVVRAEDILAAIRTSMLLGAVVPGLRAETETLAGDLTELVRLQGAIAQDRDKLNAQIAGLAAEQVKLSALVDARQRSLAAAQQNLAGEQSHADALGRQARTLRDLVDRMEGDAASARRAADEASRAAQAQALEAKERFSAAAGRDPVRLAPKLSFADAKGLLPRPVAGQVVSRFGDDDGRGGTLRGIKIATRPHAFVTAPADGWVAFAGPFRSYGRLLIINGADGYYLLLAGMNQIDVRVGQFVLGGEPVGRMGEGRSLSAALGAVETDEPVLYVELRKDGGPIDSMPWWGRPPVERVRG